VPNKGERQLVSRQFPCHCHSMSSRGVNKFEFIPNLIRKSVAVGHIKEIVAHLAQRRPNAAAPIAFLDNERNPVAGRFLFGVGFQCKK
jgi:hypothetical protein